MATERADPVSGSGMMCHVPAPDAKTTKHDEGAYLCDQTTSSEFPSIRTRSFVAAVLQLIFTAKAFTKGEKASIGANILLGGKVCLDSALICCVSTWKSGVVPQLRFGKAELYSRRGYGKCSVYRP